MRFVFVMLLLFGIAEAKRGAGPYIGGGYGESSLKDGGYYSLKESASKGYAVYAGAYINDYLSVELEYVADLDYEKKSGETFACSFTDINTQAHYPFWNKRVDVYAKFGVGNVYKENGKGFTFAYGAGLAYRFNEYFALKAGYDYFDFGLDSDGDDVADRTMALGYLFGSFEVQF